MTAAPAEEPARSIARRLLLGVKPHADKMAAYGPEVRANTIVGLSFAVLALVDEVAGLRNDLADQSRDLAAEFGLLRDEFANRLHALTLAMPGQLTSLAVACL